jgi:DNA processing protein
MNDSLLHLIALSKVPFVGSKTAKSLIAYCGSAESVFNTPIKELVKIPNIGQRVAGEIANCNVEKTLQKDIAYIEKNNLTVVSFLDERYPNRLKHFEDSPMLLYVDGNSDLNTPRTVGIVGTRTPTQYGKNATYELISQLQSYNVQIISGLAYGVDSIAHQHCVNEGIDNLAIMGTGIDQLYPSQNYGLAQKIKHKGALVTEFSLGTKPDRENFPMRNRIIAAMSDAIVVVQSAIKGGSLITAEFANFYNKDVFALPGRTSDEMSAGCNHLIKVNKAHLLESAKDIGYIMRWDQGTHSGGKQQLLFLDLTEDEAIVVDLLKSHEECAIDWLHHMTQFSLSKLAGLLLGLEFKGIVNSLPGKKYALLK